MHQLSKPEFPEVFYGAYILSLAADGDFVEKASKAVAKEVRENNRKAGEVVEKTRLLKSGKTVNPMIVQLISNS